MFDSPFIASGPTSEQITKGMSLVLPSVLSRLPGIQVHSVPGVLVLNLIDDIPSSSSSDSCRLTLIPRSSSP